MAIIKLNLRLASVPVSLIGTDGKPQEYELCEMTAEQRDGYMEDLGKRMARDKDGKTVAVTNYQGLQASLVGRCLFKKGERKPVEVAIIQAWPAGAVDALFKEAQRLNHLGESEKEIAEASKNASGVSGETGSKLPLTSESQSANSASE